MKSIPTQAIVTILGIAGVLLGAYNHVIGEARAQTATVLAPMSERLQIVEAENKAVKADVHEVQADIRALYKAVMTGAPQPRLESDAGP
jgi:hypothetical protein